MPREVEPKRYSRRSFGSGLFKLAGVLGASAILKMGRLPNLSRDVAEGGFIREDLSDKLQGESFQTIAHNGANASDNFEVFRRTNCDYIEIDVFTHNGEVYVGHPDKLAGIPIDSSKSTIGLDNPVRKFSEVAEEVFTDGKKLFIDFKDGPSVGRVFDFLAEKQMLETSSFTSTAWGNLIEIRNRQGGNCDNLFFTIQNDEDFEKFIEYDKFPRAPFGVSLDKKSATRENIQKLKARGAIVYVYTVDTPEGALNFIGDGADGITTNNISLMNIKPLQA